MKKISVWKNNCFDVSFSSLDSDKDVDVLIIGGGITGISTLYHLKNSGLNVMLAEQNKIGFSVTGNSTGKLSYLQNDLIDKIRTSFNDDIASKYLSSQKDAISLVCDIVSRENIDCDLEKVDSYLYTNQDDEVRKVKNLEEFLKKNNISVNKAGSDLVKSKYMISVSDTYMFNPVKFVQSLSKELNSIYENTSIKKIIKGDGFYICYSDKYKIKAKYVIIASHYPYFNLPFLFPIKCSLEKSYLSASKYSGSSISLISYSNPFISIRSYKDYLIYLSNSHYIHTNVDDKKNFWELKKKIDDLNLKPDYLWSNIDIITNDGLPYIGKLKDNLLIGTGYNTWGLATGVLAGKILSDIILENSNEYVSLFNPKRFNFSQAIGIFDDSFKNMSGYVSGFLDRSGKIIYKKEVGKCITINGDVKLYRKCPHLGCDLIYNEVENTWDCPCHGSRFSFDGKVLSAPANKSIKID